MWLRRETQVTEEPAPKNDLSFARVVFGELGLFFKTRRDLQKTDTQSLWFRKSSFLSPDRSFRSSKGRVFSICKALLSRSAQIVDLRCIVRNRGTSAPLIRECRAVDNLLRREFQALRLV